MLSSNVDTLCEEFPRIGILGNDHQKFRIYKFVFHVNSPSGAMKIRVHPESSPISSETNK